METKRGGQGYSIPIHSFKRPGTAFELFSIFGDVHRITTAGVTGAAPELTAVFLRGAYHH